MSANDNILKKQLSRWRLRSIIERMKAKLSLVRNLLEKRNARKKEGKFVVEGPHLVEEAEKFVDFVVYSEELPILEKLRARGLECLRISRKQFADLTEVEAPQGILAVVNDQKFELRDALKSANPLVLFCIEVQDPNNLGTMIRTADAVGASGIILSRGTVDLYNPKVIRGTMGSFFHLPIIPVDDPKETIDHLKQRKVKITATDVAAQKSYYEIDYHQAAAILVGNEASGLPKEVLELCDEIVKIPMPGKAQSLNVSIATAIVLYEALRQRTYGNKN